LFPLGFDLLEGAYLHYIALVKRIFAPSDELCIAL
jgi:hypothetical protein